MLIAAAVRDTQGELWQAVREDVPAFATWAAALVAIGALGFVPGFAKVSRWLLARVVLVLIVNNAPQIVAGFEKTWNKSNG